MPRLALLDLLPDFGSQPGAAAFEPPQVIEVPAEAPVEEPATEIDVAATIAEEVAKAEAAVTERLTALYEATLQAERDSRAAEHDELRRALGAEAAGQVEKCFAAMEEQLLALTTTATARVLGGVLTDEIRTRAVAALSARISEAIRDGEAVRIRVAGPQSLCEALAASLGDHAGSVEFSERPGFELTVNIDSSIYETRLAEWSGELAGILA